MDLLLITYYLLLFYLFLLFSGSCFAAFAGCCNLTGLRTLGTVLRAALRAAAYTGGVQGTTDDVGNVRLASL